MAKAAGQEGAFGALPASIFDTEGLTQANQAFGKLWSSAIELSRTISRSMQGGEKAHRTVSIRE